MNLFFISDIHGSEYYLKKALENYRPSRDGLIVILGDILYHGARNPLPKGYNPKGVIEILNGLADRIIAVRGNCDSEVDQMVLDFPLMSTYSNLVYNNRRIFLTHGHIYNQEKMVKLEEGSLFVYGHTHIARADKEEGIFFLNPGSISLGKGSGPNSFARLEGNSFKLLDLDGGLLREIEID